LIWAVGCRSYGGCAKETDGAAAGLVAGGLSGGARPDFAGKRDNALPASVLSGIWTGRKRETRGVRLGGREGEATAVGGGRRREAARIGRRSRADAGKPGRGRGKAAGDPHHHAVPRGSSSDGGKQRGGGAAAARAQAAEAAVAGARARV
jgi:hypothetical protein